MTTKINLSEADFNLIKVKLIEFLNRDESPFKEYNFKSSALSGILDVCAYITSYLASYLNLSINEIFMQTAILEKSVYSLIHNFNYIPKLNGPAKAYMRIRYYRNKTDNIILNVGSGEGSGFQEGESVSGATSGASGTIDVIVSDAIYVKDVTGTFSSPEVITGSITGATGTTSSIGAGDANVGDDSTDKKFTTYFNYVNYTSEYKAIPTFRDKYVEDQYQTLNIGVDDVTTENKAIFGCSPYIDTSTNTRYLQSIVPLYQAEWKALELTSIDTSTFEQLVYLSSDGTINGTMYGDKVIYDTIRVFVKESGIWYEYENLRLGLFDHDNKRAFQLKYSEDYGVYIKFNIDGYARNIQDGEDIRIFFTISEGDDINEEDGVNLFSSTANNISDIGYTKILLTDSSTGSPVNSDIFELDSGTAIVGSSTKIEMQITDSGDVNGESTFLTNGTPKQTIEDIKESAPLFYSTQGRAVTENDFNYLLKKRYTEYADVRAWGGQKEFVDLSAIISDTVSAPLLDAAAVLAAIKTVMGTMYKTSVYDHPYLTVKDATQDTLETGEHIRDKGYIYYTIADNDFKFEKNSDAINDVKSFIEKYKILSIYEKYMYPTYAILQPNINIKLKSAYTKTFQLRNIKQRIYEYINELSKVDEKFYISSLYSQINGYDEVDYVQNISYTVKAKVKNQYTATDYTYVRLYTPISSEINTTIETTGTNYTFVTEEITNPTDPDYGLGKIKINGVDKGRINYKTGIMRYQYNFGVEEYYIPQIPTSGNKLFSVKDCFYGVEYLSDIVVVVE